MIAHRWNFPLENRLTIRQNVLYDKEFVSRLNDDSKGLEIRGGYEPRICSHEISCLLSLVRLDLDLKIQFNCSTKNASLMGKNQHDFGG